VFGLRYEDLQNIRSAVYFDWGIRDLVIRAVIHLFNKGFNKQRIDAFIEYLIRKIREDYNHVTAVLYVASLFRRQGCQVILTELQNKLIDLVVVSPTRIFLVEVKPTPPPWCGLNRDELEEYRHIPYSVYYVWKESSGWCYTIVDNIEVKGNCLYVKAKYPLQRLIEMAR